MGISRTELGRTSEDAVAGWLVAQGCSIVARNLRLGALEIDIVARQAALILVVEVRFRGPTARTTAFGSISETKRERLRRAARYLWDRRYARDASVERLRIDAASVTFCGGTPKVNYCPGAVVLW